MIKKSKSRWFTTALALSVGLICVTGTAVAGKGGSPNGQPFQALNEAIATNAEAIAANASQVETLQAQVSDMDLTMGGIQDQITDLTLRVDSNTDQINELFANDALLASDLDALRAQHEADLVDIEGKITNVTGMITQLQSDLNLAIADVNTRIADLELLHDSDVTNLLALVTQALADIVRLDNELDQQGQLLVTLQNQQVNLGLLVDGLEQRAGALEGRVTALEGYHITAEQCDTGNDLTTGDPWVVCEADADEAWISADDWGTYYPDDICQQLGYSSMGEYGGNCGSICGWCQGSTSSCSAPGTKKFDGGGYANAPQLRYTVTWTCVK